MPTHSQLELWNYHRHPHRYQARLQVIKLYYQGWEKSSISRFLQVSRPMVDTWIARFEAEQFAGLREKKRGPKTPPRKIWLPRMIQVYHLQKAHPDAGEFRLWSLLAQPDIAVRTVGRLMALNKLVYDDIPHVPPRRRQSFATIISLGPQHNMDSTTFLRSRRSRLRPFRKAGNRGRCRERSWLARSPTRWALVQSASSPSGRCQKQRRSAGVSLFRGAVLARPTACRPHGRRAWSRPSDLPGVQIRQ
jgi:hypothetical protein